jgi:hypothetical protein
VSVASRFEEDAQRLVPFRSEPAVLVLLACVNTTVPVNSREKVLIFLSLRTSFLACMSTPDIFFRIGGSTTPLRIRLLKRFIIIIEVNQLKLSGLTAAG